MSIKIVIAHSEERVRNGLASILQPLPDLEVIATTDNAPEALSLSHEQRPNVVVVEADFPQVSGIEIASQTPAGTFALLVGTSESVPDFLVFQTTNVRGYLLEDTTPGLVIEGVRAAARGHVMIVPAVLAQMLGLKPDPSTLEDTSAAGLLSDREMEVATRIGRGMTNAEIAEDLEISLTTVKSHVSRIQTRLKLRNRVEIAARLWSEGVMDQTASE